MEDSTNIQSPQMSPQSIKEALQYLRANPHPHLENPTGCPKRASVAIIIRIRPLHGHPSVFDPQGCSHNLSFDNRLNSFFDQTWVQMGIPEILFIKRAARATDRWGGHVAFPGGARENTDADDCAVSIRETEEEIGLSLAENYCLKVGNLPERLITAAWGRRPLMVLCPFVFLVLRYDIAPLDPQPSEVESIHWVPVHSLLDPAMRSYQSAGISDRVVPLQIPSVKSLLRALGGNLVFGAVRLLATESKFSIPRSSSRGGNVGTIPTRDIVRNAHASPPPLILWGLTLGITADFLTILDPQGTAKLWSWPTFQHWDFRFFCWLFTHSLRNARGRSFAIGSRKSARDQQIEGVDGTSYTVGKDSDHIEKGLNIAGAHFLDEYFEQMKRALTVAVGVRVSLGTIALATTVHRLYRRC